MKALKLFIIFLVLVGGVFLAISWGFIFGNTSGEDDVDEYAKKEAVDQAAKDQVAKEETAKKEAAKEKVVKEKVVKEKVVKEKVVKEEAELIKFISQKPKLNAYRNHPGYGLLSKEEKTTIEVFLTVVHDFDNYVGNHKLNRKGKAKLKKLVEQNYTFSSMRDIENVRNEIINIMNEEANKIKK